MVKRVVDWRLFFHRRLLSRARPFPLNAACLPSSGGARAVISIEARRWIAPRTIKVETMQPDQDSEAAADTRRPEFPAASETNTFPRRLSIPRAVMNVLIGPLRAEDHPALRCRLLASSTSGRGHGEPPLASFSIPADHGRHGVIHRQRRRMRSRLRAVRVLSGKSACADRSFFPDRFCSLWRPLQPVRRYANRERSGPP